MTSLRAIALAIARSVGAKAPRIMVSRCRTCAPRGWAGRYSPAKRTVFLGVGRRMLPKLKRAFALHELAHFAAHEKFCVRPKKKGGRCRYVGDHDRVFYRELAALHRRYGVTSQAAEAFERGSGYKPPRGWRRR